MALNSLNDSEITDIGKLFQDVLSWGKGYDKKKIYSYHFIYQVGEEVRSCNNAKLSNFETTQPAEK